MKVAVPQSGEVSALLELPKRPLALLVLAHGAGAGMQHPWLESLAQALAEESIATLRYQFPYLEAGKKRTDSPAVATATVQAAVAFAKKKYPKLPLFAGGKSFGARMTTTAAADGLAVQGIVCFGFPLHPAKQPAVKRADHLAKVKLPILFLQGTRDALADLKLFKPILAKHRHFQLQIIEHADHGFAVLKSSGRTNDEVLAELARQTANFCRKLL